jgi:hypothetical protein
MTETMRNYRLIPTLALMAAMSVLACGESCGGTKAQGGDADNQAAGYAPEQEQGTAVNDTSPHRPAAPGQQP